MKKVFSIAFLLLLFFNIGGYYLVFYSLQYKVSYELTKQFDAGDYADDETVTLKIPIALPYPIHTNGFERVNGAFEYKGEPYKLVKQKLEGDTLYVVCFKDQQAKKILNAFSDFAKFSNDIPVSSKSPITFMGKMLKDYQPGTQPEIIKQDGWCMSTFFSETTVGLPQHELPVYSPPPEPVNT